MSAPRTAGRLVRRGLVGALVLAGLLAGGPTAAQAPAPGEFSAPANGPESAGAELVPGLDPSPEKVDPHWASLQRIAAAREQSFGAARARVAAEPELAGAWLALAESALAVGDRVEALTALRGYLERAGQPLPRIQVRTARLERLMGENGAAERRLRALVDSPPAAAGGDLLLAQGDAYRLLAEDEPALFRSALQRYEAALRIEPGSIQAQVAIGDLLLDRYNNTEALEAFRAALRIDPEHTGALFGLARSQRFDHSPQAEQTLRRILDGAPEFNPARVLLARLLIDSEHYAEAEVQVRMALLIDPHSPPALTTLAAIHYLRDEARRFEAVLERVRELAPGDAGIYRTLAEVAGRNRRYRNAAEFAAMAVRLDDSSWRGHALLGENRLRLGDMEGGRSSLETAFRGDPYDARTKNTLDLLDRLREFSIQRSRRFLLVAAPGEAAVLAPRLLPIAERAFDFFVERYDHQPPTPIRIEIYPRHEDFSVRTVGLVGVDIVGVSFGPVVALDSPSAGNFGPFNWASALWHEIAHSFHLSLTRSRVPRWFTEGLAVYEEHAAGTGWGGDVSPGFLRAFRQGRLAPASDLNSAFLRPTYPEQIPHAYFQASLLMEMIVQSHGFEAILGMLRGYAEGLNTIDLLQRQLGRDAQAFDREFEAFVEQRYASSLAGLAGADGAAGKPGGGYGLLLDQARQAQRDGDSLRALLLAGRARDLFPDHGGPGSAYDLLARIHRARGEIDAAVVALSASVGIDADHLEGFRELAELQRMRGESAAAAAALERALLIQPFDPAIHRDLAEIHAALGNWPLVADARAAIAALQPADPVGARYQLALALSRSGQSLAARRQVLLALEAAPLYEEALELLLTVRDQIEESATRPASPELPEASPARPGEPPIPYGL